MPASAHFGYPGDYVLWWLVLLSLLIHTWCFFRFFPRKRYRKTGLVAGNALVLLCLLGFAGIIGETYYRYICVQMDPFGISLPAQRWIALHVNLNSYGCRDEEWTAAARPGVKRVAFVGDSFVYGWGVENPADRFPELAAGKLSTDTDRTVEALNVAKPGWNTAQQATFVDAMLESIEVDEVVLCHVMNDIEDLLPTEPGFDPTAPPYPQWLNPDASYLLHQLHLTLVVPRLPTVHRYHDWLADGYANRDIVERHLGRMARLVATCRERGVGARVAFLPFVRAPEGLDQRKINNRMAASLNAAGIPAVDLSGVFDGHDPSELVVNHLDSHPNESGHRLIAEKLAGWLRSVD